MKKLFVCMLASILFFASHGQVQTYTLTSTSTAIKLKSSLGTCSEYPLNSVYLQYSKDSQKVSLLNIYDQENIIFSVPDSVSHFTGYGTKRLLDSFYNCCMVSSGSGGGGGGVSSITAGDGLSGGTITSSGTISVTNPTYSVTVPLSSAALLSVNTTPVTLVASPGAGKFIKVIGIVWDFTYGSVAYTSVVLTLYEGGVAYKYLTTFCITNASTFAFDIGLNVSATGSNTASNNSSTLTEGALTLSASSNPTLGDGTAKITIIYEVVTRSP